MSENDDNIYGWYDEYENPCISFHLCGVAHEEPGLEYEGVIDTGFSGFITLPFDEAFALQLPLEGTAGVTLADGSSQTVLTALGIVTLADMKITGTVELSLSPEILVGMEFLRKFKYGLAISKGSVYLFPDPS